MTTESEPPSLESSSRRDGRWEASLDYTWVVNPRWMLSLHLEIALADLQDGQLNCASLNRIDGAFTGGSLAGSFIGNYDALLSEIRTIHETNGEHWGVGVMERQ